MIRIDEIYNNTFWPWLRQNCPGTRMFFCDPPGNTNPDALFNFGSDDIKENNYVFFHDQEPVHLDSFADLFNEVVIKNLDFTVAPDILEKYGPPIWNGTPVEVWAKEFYKDGIERSEITIHDFFRYNKDYWFEYKKLNENRFEGRYGHVIVSERGDYVEQLTQKYGWQSHYYFYHGWACQDWFRGYDKTFLIPRARDRRPTQTFISPNRIVAGKRDHRVLFLYNVFKQKLEHNWISAPRTCVYENVDISAVASKYNNIYPDIEQVFNNADLPRLFPGEETQQMASCWLTNFDESADSLVYVPTETVYFGRRQHITEKTFKAIALEMPFVLVAPAGSLAYMREYGFKTFGDVIDESYDEETDDIRRVERVVRLLKDLDSLSVKERQQLHRAMLPAVEHNYNHFYNGGLTDVLWKELLGVLNELSFSCGS